MSGSRLIVEVGAEEIPASYIEPALRAFKERLAGLLIGGPKGCERIEVWGTPNRLAVGAWGLLAKAEDEVREVTGPPASAGFDAEGRPTKAALGFAKGQGVSVEDLIRVETAKGEYLVARRTVPGRRIMDILAEQLPSLILGLPFPKSMRWGQGEVTFVRPIHWVLAVLDGEVIPFSLGEIQSGRVSYGHRFLSPNPAEILSPDDYEDRLAQAQVIVSIEKRQDLVRQELERVTSEKKAGLKVVPDEDLVAEVANMVELPVAVCGRYDDVYLEMPDVLPITAMREHQRYFAVTDEAGRLKPYFVAVNNIRARDMDLVTRGHERVLRARLDDARFYFVSDRKRTLASRLDDLKKVVYHTLLGTSFEKVSRTQALAGHLADRLAPDLKPLILRAAELCKCDLVSGVVGEFPTLQGITGRILAELDGEPALVSRAIEEHYLPSRAGGDLPQSPVGVVLALADKIETIVGCFGVGLIPTGGADPYALRRQALGVIHIVLDQGFHLPLGEVIDQALSGLGSFLTRPAGEVRGEVIEFFRQRLKFHLTSQGASTDGAEAVLSLYHDDILSAAARVRALEEIKGRPDFQDLAVAFKRVVNIVRKFGEQQAFDAGVLSQPEEKDLHQALAEVEAQVGELARVEDYAGLLQRIAGLKPRVDMFFDKVLVDDPDPAVKKNRLALLTRSSALFAEVADFSKIST